MENSEQPLKKYVRRTRTPEQALSSLMRMCARSEKSGGDALRLMRGWGVEEKDRRKILDKLLEQRFIDDGRYAGAFVREKINLSGWGEYKIRRALQTKGIEKSLIDEAMALYADRDRMQDRLRVKLTSKNAKMEGTPYERKGKLMRYGLSMGYDYESVVSAVEELVD